MQSVGKLDDYNRAFSRRAQETPYDSSTRFPANFAQNDFHKAKLAQLFVAAKRTRKNPAFVCIREYCAHAQTLPPLPRRTGDPTWQNAALSVERGAFS